MSYIFRGPIFGEGGGGVGGLIYDGGGGEEGINEILGDFNVIFLCNIRNVTFVSKRNFKAVFHSGKFSIGQNFFDLLHAPFLISMAKKISSQKIIVGYVKKCAKIIPFFNSSFF